MAVDARTMAAFYAIKQSIQMGASPGLSVNTHPNTFFLNVVGEIDLLKAAELALQRVDEYDKAMAAKTAKESASKPVEPVYTDHTGFSGAGPGA